MVQSEKGLYQRTVKSRQQNKYFLLRKHTRITTARKYNYFPVKYNHCFIKLSIKKFVRKTKQRT